MFPSSSSPSQQLLWSLYNNRRLLMQQSATSPTASSPESNDTTSNNRFDANVVMVLSVLLCAIVCSLALNFLIRCVLSCFTFVSRDSDPNNNNNNDNAAPRLANNTGVKKAALKTFPIVSYKADLNIPGLDTECVICLSEFVAGERVRLLPKCSHGFHARCIDKWLSAHSSCPTCRHCLIETCHKIVGYTAPETVVVVDIITPATSSN